MFNKFYDIYTSEWYKLIKPFGLLDKLLQFMHISLPFAANIVNYFLAYKYRKLNSSYTFVNIPPTNIHSVNNYLLAGTDSKADYEYTVEGIQDTFYMLGCGFTDNIAFLGVDYIVKDDVYFFKEHPSKYCFTFKHKDNIEYNTVGGVGSQISVIHPKQRNSYSKCELSASLYDNIMRLAVGNSLNTLYMYQQGVYATKGLHGVVKQLWEDTSYKFAILDTGSFIIAHKDSKLLLQLNEIPRLQNTLQYFTVNLNFVDYPVSMITNNINNYPGLLQKYPMLTVTNDIFIGSELYNILKNQGCSFTEIPYINNYDIDNTLLNQSMHQGIKLMYLGTVHASNTFACASEAKESLPVQFSDTSFSTIKIDIKYIY